MYIYFVILLINQQTNTYWVSTWLSDKNKAEAEGNTDTIDLTKPLSLRELKSKLISITDKNTQKWESSKF